MSPQEQSLAERLFGAAADRLKEAPQEIGAELKRLGVQGQMELASALFGNGPFVPYGPGAYSRGQGKEAGRADGEEKEHGQQQDGHGIHGPEQGREPPHLERGGRSM